MKNALNRCPITYESLAKGKRYSLQGLKRLSRSLTHMEPFPYSHEEQVREAGQRYHKMSIQGVQPKLSARLNIKKGVFEVVNIQGRYILKPQNPMFSQLPENEDLTMRMAAKAGIDVPLHGLIYSRDNSMTYFVKRFDRISKNKKVPLEDFAQLTGQSRETKYASSMEKVAGVIENYCTFPAIDKVKLFRLTLFNFLTGNEDMHLKNFSLITQKEKTFLSPAYDLLNTTIVIGAPIEELEEIALPIAGKKRKLTRELIVDYYGKERLGLNSKVIANTLDALYQAIPEWQRLISISFLKESLKAAYKELLEQRMEVLEK